MPELSILLLIFQESIYFLKHQVLPEWRELGFPTKNTPALFRKNKGAAVEE